MFIAACRHEHVGNLPTCDTHVVVARLYMEMTGAVTPCCLLCWDSAGIEEPQMFRLEEGVALVDVED